MSGKIALVTDSTCDLPPDLVERYHIHVVPQHILWDGYTYLDGVHLPAGEFYRRLATSETLPQSAPPSPHDFAGAYEAARAASGADQVVSLILSSRLSESFANAQMGAREVDFPAFVLDTQTVSMGLGFCVLAAAEAIQAGANVDGIFEIARRTRRNTRIFFTLNTLDFLYRGGRIGGARHLIGTALALKPILTVADGQVEPAETVRTRQRAVNRMLELAADEVAGGEDCRVAVTSGDADEEALSMLGPLRQRLNPKQLVESRVSPAVGTNAGPGVLGLVIWRC